MTGRVPDTEQTVLVPGEEELPAGHHLEYPDLVAGGDVPQHGLGLQVPDEEGVKPTDHVTRAQSCVVVSSVQTLNVLIELSLVVT